MLEEIPGILNIGAYREPVAGEITIRQPQLVQGSQSTARSLRVQSQQLLAESQIFKDEVLVRAESADHPAEEMSSDAIIARILPELSGFSVAPSHTFKLIIRTT